MSIKHGYQPLRPASKDVSEETMRAILQRNTALKQPATPKVLEWGEPVWTSEAKTCGHLISVCERYMIDKGFGTYSSYRRATVNNHRGEYLGYTKAIDEAKALCEADVAR